MVSAVFFIISSLFYFSYSRHAHSIAFLFCFLNLYYCCTRGPPTQLTTKVLFYLFLWRTHKRPRTEPPDSKRKPQRDWQMATSGPTRLFALEGLGAKRFHRRDIVLLVHNWRRKVYGWRFPRCWTSAVYSGDTIAP